MSVIIRDYRPDDWPAVCRVHDRSRPDELRGSFDARAFVPLAEDSERAYINACAMFVAQPEDDIGAASLDEAEEESGDLRPAAISAIPWPT